MFNGFNEQWFFSPWYIHILLLEELMERSRVPLVCGSSSFWTRRRWIHQGGWDWGGQALFTSAPDQSYRARALLSVASGDQSHGKRQICRAAMLFPPETLPTMSLCRPSLRAQHPSTRLLTPTRFPVLAVPQHHHVFGTNVSPRAVQHSRHPLETMGKNEEAATHPVHLFSVPSALQNQAAASSSSAQAGHLPLAKAFGCSCQRRMNICSKMLGPHPASLASENWAAASKGGGFYGYIIAGKMLMHLCGWLPTHACPSLKRCAPFPSLYHPVLRCSLPFLSTSLELPPAWTSAAAGRMSCWVGVSTQNHPSRCSQATCLEDAGIGFSKLFG